MPQTVEVRFKGIRRDFFLWPDSQDPLRLREAVVVECDRGQDLGRVHTSGDVAEKKCGGGCSGCDIGTAPKTTLVAEEAGEAGEAGEPATAGEAGVSLPAPPAASAPAVSPALRSVLRRATQEDIQLANQLRRSEEQARRQATDRVRHHQLDMKVSDAEWQWDRSKLTLYFTAEKRVDFRALVRDLASTFRTRIELRQIGVRDEAARLGGVGRCGREYCCSTWLTELSPVSLALAKDQHLSLNPAQISGGCGRLLCCLKYEHEFYVAARKRFPREGKMLTTLRGPEKVIAVDIFRERVFLRNEEGSRIVTLVDLREEQERVDALDPSAGSALIAERSGPARPVARESFRRTRPNGGGPVGAGQAGGSGRSDQISRRPPGGAAPDRSEPPPATGSPRGAPPTPPSSEAAGRPGDRTRRPRRRRRGRRRGRDNPGGPPPTAGSPED
jgi:cell fate regulator YaaT (PSP1 superfamily)